MEEKLLNVTFFIKNWKNLAMFLYSVTLVSSHQMEQVPPFARKKENFPLSAAMRKPSIGGRKVNIHMQSNNKKIKESFNFLES